MLVALSISRVRPIMLVFGLAVTVGPPQPIPIYVLLVSFHRYNHGGLVQDVSVTDVPEASVRRPGRVTSVSSPGKDKVQHPKGHSRVNYFTQTTVFCKPCRDRTRLTGKVVN